MSRQMRRHRIEPYSKMHRHRIEPYSIDPHRNAGSKREYIIQYYVLVYGSDGSVGLIHVLVEHIQEYECLT
jgi:hypothetical protein